MPAHSWTAADEQHLRQRYADTPLNELAERLGCSVKAIRSRARLLKVKRSGPQLWTPQEEQYLRDRYGDTFTRDIAEHLRRPLHKVYNKAKRLGLSKPDEYLHDPANRCRLLKGSDIGAAFRFPAGHEPANKGVRRPGYAPGRMAETQFKKGTLNGTAAQLHRPIGTILADPEGYLRIKVREHDESTRGWHKDVWPLLHHQVWKERKGPIPEGHIIVFKDKDRSNCALDNMELISLKENMRRNSLWNTMPKELAHLVQLTGAIKRQINRRDNADAKTTQE